MSNIARDGAAKKLSPPAIHPGMTSKQQAGFGTGGIPNSIGGYLDASPANPLDSSNPGKNLKATPDAFGMKHVDGKSQDDRHSVGARVWAEALNQGDAMDRLAHTGLPDRIDANATENPVRQP
jgi:hypothetical protein